MQITHEDRGSKGTFTLHDGSKIAGEMHYTWAGETMFIIDSTHVDEAYRGKNVGKQLLDSVVDFARERAVKIMPLCPFAKASFDKNPAIHDVLKQ